MEILIEIKKLIGSEKLIIGADRVLKYLKAGKIEKVILASNCNKDVFGEIEHFANFSEVKIEKLDIPNDELGTVCKKPFSVAVVGILK
ncbi:ribosomal L7Ae/L30e/S12e/Gadd45 family protein [archaeon]|nr:ribosomal L7Ae/L30e/S12e/Gadd45 family protein [archaeon]MBL7057130.1 ribosomal L7Ae/L30e/S12e/Gadd45 family protein [Candidatus Woesearchaeota archaeon]